MFIIINIDVVYCIVLCEYIYSNTLYSANNAKLIV